MLMHQSTKNDAFDNNLQIKAKPDVSPRFCEARWE